MIITAITAQKKDTSRVNIFIDNAYSFSLTLDQLLSEKISKGMVIDELELKRLEKISEDGKLRNRALEWVMLRPRSQHELKQYLLRKGADAALVEAICSEFAAKKYQDDIAFAKWWIEGRLRKNKSNISIATELYAKGVSRETVATLLADTAAQTERLKQLIVQKNLLTKYPDALKLKQYLVGKGYRYSEIDEVLAELKEEGRDSF